MARSSVSQGMAQMDVKDTKELCVVHLLRRANGIEAFQRFLESYRANPGGIVHDLVIVFKGFSAEAEKAPYRKLLTEIPFQSIDISDEGLDITAYFAALNHYAGQYRYFCFLNSYSVILDGEWLKKLYSHIIQPGVGLVGATGAWLSHRTNAIVHFMNPIAYFKSLRKRGGVSINRAGMPRTGNSKAVIIEWLSHVPFYLMNFDSFPNYHIRTNAFMIAGDVMQSLHYPKVLTKFDAYQFESGKHGLTQRILAMDKKVLVVGKDGKAYEKEVWNHSQTLFQANQKNLLVADNRTIEYAEGTKERRDYLTAKAWQ